MRSPRLALAFAAVLVLAGLLASSRAEAATLCGLACPAGQFAQSFSFSSSCCTSPSSCIPTNNNQVSCAAPTVPSFSKCGLSCPSGFHPFQYISSVTCCACLNCSSCNGNQRNQAVCITNSGNQFDSCGACPAGFAVTSRFFKFDCCGNTLSSTCNGLLNNAVRCQKI